MSEDNTDTATIAAPLPDAAVGSAERFDAAAATRAVQQTTVREGSPEDLNSKIEEANDVTKAKVEKKPAEEKSTEKKGDIPDFSKKPESKPAPEPGNYEEELKQHPAIKGEAAKSFAKVAAARDEALRVAAAHEARIKELESKGSTAPSKAQEEALQAAIKRAQDLENELGKVSYESSPRIKKFVAAEKQEIESAKSYLDGDDAQQAAVETAAALSGQKRLKVLVDAGMNAETIAAVSASLTRVDQLRRERTAEVENWRESSTQHEQQQKAAQIEKERRAQEQEEAVFQGVFSKLSPTLEAFQKVDGYDDWNKGVEDRISQAKKYFSGNASLEELADVVTRGVALDAQRKITDSLQKKYDAMAEELSRLKAASNPNGSVRTGSDTTQQDGGTAASRFDATLSTLKGR